MKRSYSAASLPSSPPRSLVHPSQQRPNTVLQTAMATVVTPLDTVDPATASLILQLQLHDVHDLLISSKDKNNDGELSDAQVALSLLSEHLEFIQSFMTDRQMTQSIADAVQADAQEISSIIREEETAYEDHAFAHRLNGNNVTSGGRPQLNTLTGRTLARLAGQYISENAGQDLLNSAGGGKRGHVNEAAQAGGSAKRLCTNSRSSVSNQLDCVACGENRKYFDVIQVPCCHAYCMQCLQELVSLATKDESLFPPRCCKEHFEMDEVRIFLSKELRDQYALAKVEFAMRDRTYCSRPDCAAFIPPDSTQADKAKCLRCPTLTCGICKKEAHQSNCPDDPALKEILDLARQSGWQRCSACQRLVELEFGCNHIT